MKCLRLMDTHCHLAAFCSLPLKSRQLGASLSPARDGRRGETFTEFSEHAHADPVIFPTQASRAMKLVHGETASPEQVMGNPSHSTDSS